MTLEITKTRIWVTSQDEMLEFTIYLYSHINDIAGQVSSLCRNIEAPDLGGIWEKVATQRAEVRSLVES